MLIPRPSPDSDSSAILTLPQPIISHLVWSCFTAIVKSDETVAPTVFQKPLSLVYQRYPAIWSAQTKEFSTRLQATNDGALPRLLQAMNAVLGGTTLSADASTALVISSSSPDVAIRVSALKDVFKNADEIKANGNESFIRETLLARLGEPDQEVASVVFAKETRSVLEETLEAQEILEALKSPVEIGDVAYLSVVLPYLAGPFVSSHAGLADQVVKTIMWPRLLSSKADSKANAVTFDALRGSALEKTHAWLKNASLARSNDGVKTNSHVVDTIARNLAALPSKELDDAIAFLLVEIAQPEPSLLSLLVAGRFAAKVEKSRRVDFATSVLAAVQVEQRGLDSLAGAQADKLFDESGSLDATLLQNIYVHPTVAKTSRQVRAAAVVDAVRAVHPVQEACWNWLSAVDEKDQTVLAYRTLCTTVYRIAHTNSSTQGSAALATSLLSTLFTSLVADDVLAFLASIFTSADVAVELRLSALRDSVVFIDVLSAANDKKAVDWQTVVPCVLAALGDAEKKIRVEGLKVLEKIRDVAVAKQGSKTGSVYGRDRFYGSSSCQSLSRSKRSRDVLTPPASDSFAQVPRGFRPPRLPHQGSRVSQRDYPFSLAPRGPPCVDARLVRQSVQEEEGLALVQGFDFPPRPRRGVEVALGSRQAAPRPRGRQGEGQVERPGSARRRVNLARIGRPHCVRGVIFGRGRSILRETFVATVRWRQPQVARVGRLLRVCHPPQIVRDSGHSG